jgi:type 2 lantibiotic biosynthesis protein LanM
MKANSSRISPAQLRTIVARASTLFERLDPQRFSPSPTVDKTLLQSRLNAWGQAVAKGDFEHFQRCLEWDGLDLEMAKRAVSSVDLRQDATLPCWAETLSSVLDLAASTLATEPELEAETQHRFLNQQKPLPFEQILSPFVHFAQRELMLKAGKCYQRLTDQVHAVLERALLSQLIDTATQPIQLTFTTWQLARQSSFTRLLTRIQTSPRRSLYTQFVREMLQGDLVSFFVEYATLARLLAMLTDLWVESQNEFLQRLNADWSAIAKTFGTDAPLGQVIDAKPLLSDPHRGRRSVTTLTIEPNLHLVYKPKHLGIEQAYNQMLVWLNAEGSPLPLKALRVIDCGTYGWVEFVESLPCTDIAQLKRHYQRAGMLLCLTYVLDATDCHYENMIASGEHPVLIDTETLMQHRPKNQPWRDGKTAQQLAFKHLYNSVTRTALLPVWEHESSDNPAFDFSGLGSHAQQVRYLKGLQWSFVNTDQMALKFEQIKVPPPSNHVPTVDGTSADLSDWIETIVLGFKQMYHFLLDTQEDLLLKDSPLWKMAGQPVRFVFRSTNLYFRILKQLSYPEYLREGVDRSIGLEILKRPAIGAIEKPKIWSFIQAERSQMEQLDIPFFTISSDKDFLVLASDSQVEGFFQSSGFQVVLERINTLSEPDLAMQVQFIRGSLYLRMMPNYSSVVLAESSTSSSGEIQGEFEQILDESAFVAEAIAIAQRLGQQAIRGADGSITWLAPQFSFQHDRFQFQPTDNSLYGGRLGIALFLAALARVNSNGEFRDLCLSALQELRQSITQSEQALQQLPADPNIGLSVGLGGMIYGLTQVGNLLEDQNLLADAHSLARLITPDVIAGDRRLDILGGTAGTLLSLLKLYRSVQDPIILESAIACGQHLLMQSVSCSNGRAWKTLDDRLLTGFSHGTSGIAYALLKLAQITNDAKFKTAAAEAITYEQNLFLPEIGNWPDLRDFSKLLQASGSTEPPPLMSSWCHGATGIGLARLGGLTILETESIHQDLQVAIRTTRNCLAQGQEVIEQLCCGSIGQIELLLCAAIRLKDPGLLTSARLYVSKIVQKAKIKGYVLEPALHSSVYVPSFFRGETGIGYTLLRLVYPEQLPSILLWD